MSRRCHRRHSSDCCCYPRRTSRCCCNNGFSGSGIWIIAALLFLCGGRGERGRRSGRSGRC